MNFIGITTGDQDGVGLEVAAKALHRLGPKEKTRFFLMRGPRMPDLYKNLLGSRWERKVFKNLDEAIFASRADRSPGVLFEIASASPPPLWVEEATRACLDGRLNGLCTGPLSKTLIRDSGLKDKGHTDIFKRLSHCDLVNMAFIGKYFNVVLATDHIPYEKVPQALSVKRLKSTIMNSSLLRHVLPGPKQNLPMAFLALNPHAGEDGMLGRQELGWIAKLNPLFKQLNVIGPMPADTSFLRDRLTRFSIFIACYHDQGLIPFKMAHGQESGIQISLGLPFTRSSVDHGTAKDIFGKDCANPQSMFEALSWCLKLTTNKRKE